MALSRELLCEGIESRIKAGFGVSAIENDAEIIEFLLDNCEITFPPESRFFGKVSCEQIPGIVVQKRAAVFSHLLDDAGLRDGEEALAHTGAVDFSHTNAEWESILSLGIYGLRERILEHLDSCVDEKKRVFYLSVKRCYDAALRFIKRAAEGARAAGKVEMAEGLSALAVGAPRNLFEALETSIVFYNLETFFDRTYLRTMGRLDSLYYPYFVKEEREYAERVMLDYVKEIDSLGAPSNIPFAICGTDDKSNDLTNELSYLLLDVYGAAMTTNTKLHILCSEGTPEGILDKAFRLIREGKNSIVFMSDKAVISSLIRQGARREDAAKYHVVGCYECGADGELTCSCNARVNIPKALELALNGGVDMLDGKQLGLPRVEKIESYEQLLAEFYRQLDHLCECAMRSTDLREAHYREIHSSPFLSGSYTSAIEAGGDLYGEYTAKYNSSSLNALGLATAVDSLVAIERAVFREKRLTLDELVGILKADWSGEEYLRLYCKNRYPKFGQGDREVDDVARGIVDFLSDKVSRRPNVKGGGYRLGLFSINWRWSFGEKTAASADGRHAGESISQNTSASFGADKMGATAHLLSVSRIDSSKTPNGAIVDIDLHSTAVNGENGIKALVSSLFGFFELGGFAVHYNVLDTEVLMDARKNPEKYPTLQVRLCGWNVLFSSLTDREKDEFISRSMR